MKTKQDNEVTDLTSANAKNETELSWPIRLGVIYDKNQTGEEHDRSYKCGIHWKLYFIVMTNKIGCGLCWKPYMTMTWPILQVRSTLKTKLNCRDRYDCARSKTKTKQDNDVMDPTCPFYVENETKLS